VCLRGVNDSMLFKMADEGSARGAALWVADKFLRKYPADRSGVWLITSSAQFVVLDEGGVGVAARHVVIAALDPREVTSVSVEFVADEPAPPDDAETPE
jgi:hypothetical protein